MSFFSWIGKKIRGNGRKKAPPQLPSLFEEFNVKIQEEQKEIMEQRVEEHRRAVIAHRQAKELAQTQKLERSQDVLLPTLDTAEMMCVRKSLLKMLSKMDSEFGYVFKKMDSVGAFDDCMTLIKNMNGIIDENEILRSKPIGNLKSNTQIKPTQMDKLDIHGKNKETMGPRPGAVMYFRTGCTSVGTGSDISRPKDILRPGPCSCASKADLKAKLHELKIENTMLTSKVDVLKEQNQALEEMNSSFLKEISKLKGKGTEVRQDEGAQVRQLRIENDWLRDEVMRLAKNYTRPTKEKKMSSQNFETWCSSVIKQK